MRKMRSKAGKILMTGLVLILTAGIFTGCMTGGELADIYDEETVKQQAMDDIKLAESVDFDGWYARFGADVQESVTEESYHSYLEILEERGAFTEFGDCKIFGQEKNGVDYGVAIVTAGHENKDIKYVLAYDKDMKLAQFSIGE